MFLQTAYLPGGMAMDGASGTNNTNNTNGTNSSWFNPNSADSTNNTKSSGFNRQSKKSNAVQVVFGISGWDSSDVLLTETPSYIGSVCFGVVMGFVCVVLFLSCYISFVSTAYGESCMLFLSPLTLVACNMMVVFGVPHITQDIHGGCGTKFSSSFFPVLPVILLFGWAIVGEFLTNIFTSGDFKMLMELLLVFIGSIITSFFTIFHYQDDLVIFNTSWVLFGLSLAIAVGEFTIRAMARETPVVIPGAVYEFDGKVVDGDVVVKPVDGKEPAGILRRSNQNKEICWNVGSLGGMHMRVPNVHSA
jgi:hypothetical protein